ncbi:HIRAN domain-containing protein [uncultured Methanobrevibacter sp.]|uniref:HIRAN domain-containing protein n=1 Tax=uncultured Methanobrevibacter sp. TaxID=253161 RepID=UPI002610E4A7|nr:HIRAN domain-containing protein [uncultured Methanobrevibacter sp.]
MRETYQSTLDFSKKPQDPLDEARDLIEKGDFEKAFELIEGDNSPEAAKLKAEIKISLKDYKKAVGYIDEALKTAEDDTLLLRKADALYRWAKVTYFPDGNLERAMDLVDEALEISPDGKDSPEYWFLKGEIYQSEEMHIDARKCFLKAEGRYDELEILESELAQFEAHRNDVLINVTGVNFYKGIEVFEKGTILKLVRDDENEHDPDAIACRIADEVVGYVANSEYTLINGVAPASEVRSMVGDGSKAEVIMIFQNEFVIARVIP